MGEEPSGEGLLTAYRSGSQRLRLASFGSFTASLGSFTHTSSGSRSPYVPSFHAAVTGEGGSIEGERRRPKAIEGSNDERSGREERRGEKAIEGDRRRPTAIEGDRR